MNDVASNIPWDALKDAPYAIGYLLLVGVFVIYQYRRERAFQSAFVMLVDSVAATNAATNDRYSTDLRANVAALTKVHDSTKANIKAMEEMSRLVTAFLTRRNPGG